MWSEVAVDTLGNWKTGIITIIIKIQIITTTLLITIIKNNVPPKKKINTKNTKDTRLGFVAEI